jgi:hypothetical protein
MESIGSFGSLGSSSGEAPYSDENAILRHLGEKVVARINQMKKQLMDKT